MNSQRLWQRAQGMRMSKLDGVPVLKGEVDKNPYPYQILSPIDACIQMKNQSSPVESQWVCKPHLRAGTLQGSQWPTQSELTDIWGFLFVCHTLLYLDFFFLIFFFFTSQIFCLYVMVFNFVLCIFCVCEISVSLGLRFLCFNFGFFFFCFCFILFCFIFQMPVCMRESVCVYLGIQVGTEVERT